MPSNKKHHYVPKFYLKNFSSTAHQKTINLYNIARDIFKFDVGITGQCYQHYYYGEDQRIETLLSEIETKAAIIIQRALADGECPAYNSDDHMTLLYFICLQRARTKAAEIQANAFIDANMKMLLEVIHPEFGSLENVKIGLGNAVQLTVSSAGIYTPMLWDLELKLITIKDESEFFPPDNPTVFFNQFFQHYKVLVNGLASRGLQIFLPIAAKKMFVLYDADTYHIGSRTSRQIEIYRKDTEKLNILQYIGAAGNVYFAHGSQQRDIERVRDSHGTYRITDNNRMTKSIVRDKSADEDIIMIYVAKTPYRLAVDFISLRKLKNKRLMPGLRDRYRYEILKEFGDKTLDGTLSAKDFFPFCAAHPLGALVKPPTWREKGS